MNIRLLNSMMLMICPILMIVIWVVLEPLLIGEVDSGLVGAAQAEAYLKLASEKGALPYLLDIPGTFALL